MSCSPSSSPPDLRRGPINALDLGDQLGELERRPAVDVELPGKPEHRLQVGRASSIGRTGAGTDIADALLLLGFRARGDTEVCRRRSRPGPASRGSVTLGRSPISCACHRRPGDPSFAGRCADPTGTCGAPGGSTAASRAYPHRPPSPALNGAPDAPFGARNATIASRKHVLQLWALVGQPLLVAGGV